MKLNETSYVHKTIRKLCSQLEILTETKLITDLGKNFTEIQFIDKYGYIVIDYKKEKILTLSNKLDDAKIDLIREIVEYLDWLEVGNKYAKNQCNKNVTFIFQKKIDNRKRNVYTSTCKEDKSKSSKKTISRELHKM